ncbi:MAG: hypothetical protein K2M31_00320 [Muribaculaceae bacterium]|nr:hypothetical protein [Muribaculaceae bacterium]
MKKSSIILIAGIGTLIILAFIAPFILMKNDPQSKREFTLNRSGESVEIPLKGSFSAIRTGINDNHFNLEQADYTRELSLEIIESDTITTPRIIIDKSWASNVTIEVEEETLYIDVDMKSYKPASNNYSYIFIPNDNLQVACLLLPKSYGLKTLKSDRFDVNLKDFTDLSIEVPRFTDFTLSNCQVKSLTVISQ